MKEGAEKVELKIQAKVESLKHANEGDKGTEVRPIFKLKKKKKISIDSFQLVVYFHFKIALKTHYIFFSFFWFVINMCEFRSKKKKNDDCCCSVIMNRLCRFVRFLFIFEMRSCSMMDTMGMSKRMNGRMVNSMVRSRNKWRLMGMTNKRMG